MASTNKTTNYELSQYVGSDKPTYLGDYNSDMLKIDTGMKANETASSTNTSNISTINSNIGTMSSLKTTASNLVGAINENYDHIGDISNLETPVTTDVVSSINSLNTNVGDVTQLKTDTKTSTVSAINELYSLFDFTPTQITINDVLFTNCNNTGVENLAIATNADGSMFKFYGEVRGKRTAGGTKAEIQTTLRPKTAITFSPMIKYCYVNSYDESPARTYQGTFTLGTDGKITVDLNTGTAFTYVRMILPPCIYIVKDFGDQPVQI